MDVEILALCDAATESGNKINVIGVFNEIRATKEPIQLQPYGLATRIRFEKNEEGPKAIQLAIVASDKKETIFTIDVMAQAHSKPDELSANIQVVGLLPPLSLPHFGEYAIQLLIDGQLAKSIPLNVKQIPATQSGPQPQMIRPP